MLAGLKKPFALICALAACTDVYGVGTIQDTILVNSKRWLSLPATPSLPQPNEGHYVSINGIRVRITHTFLPSFDTYTFIEMN